MSRKHYLSLDFPETSNPYVLRIQDASSYDEALAVECLRFDIYLPGYTVPLYYYNLTEGFNKNLNAMDLELQAVVVIDTKVTSVAIANGGTGYLVGDVLTLSTGTGTAATFTVATIGVAGVITSVDITTAGVYTADPTIINSPTTTNSVAGTGATLTVTMGTNTSESQDLFALPDGVYQVRYSVSPNDYVYVEYLHLRTTRIKNLLKQQLCKVRTTCCEPTAEERKKLADLYYIRQVIEAAKAKVEVCHSVKEGMSMLIDAEKLLNKYINKGCLSC